MGDPLRRFPVSIRLTTGSAQDYPYDAYSVELDAVAWLTNNVSAWLDFGLVMRSKVRGARLSTFDRTLSEGAGRGPRVAEPRRWWAVSPSTSPPT